VWKRRLERKSGIRGARVSGAGNLAAQPFVISDSTFSVRACAARFVCLTAPTVAVSYSHPASLSGHDIFTGSSTTPTVLYGRA